MVYKNLMVPDSRKMDAINDDVVIWDSVENVCQMCVLARVKMNASANQLY